MPPSQISRVLFFVCVCFHLGAADAETLELDSVLNGNMPGSTAPWLTATFTTLFPGTVSLTLEAHLNVPSEFVGSIALNLNPSLAPAGLIFSQLSGPGTDQVLLPTTGDAVMLPGGGASGSGFDFLLSWPTGASTRFNGSQTCAFNISGPATLIAQDFLYYNTVKGQPGPAIIGAHIQGIPLSGGGTTSTAVQAIPEPASPTLALVALAISVACRRTPNLKSAA